MEEAGRMHCPLCGEQASLLSAVGRGGDPMRNFLCNGCGLIFRDPVEWAESGGSDMYADGEYARRHSWAAFCEPARSLSDYYLRLSSLLPAVKDRRVLDIGFGRGETLFDWRLAGAVVSGVEPMPRYREAAAGHGFEVWRAIEDIPAGTTFDVVHLRDVFEHLETPVDFLGQCRDLLAPGGVLVLRTPNAARPWTHRPRAEDWFDPGHVYGYAPWHLKHLLGLAGFEVAGVEVDSDIYVAACPGEAREIPLPPGAEKVRSAFDRFSRQHWFRRPLWRLGKRAAKAGYYAKAVLRRLGV